MATPDYKEYNYEDDYIVAYFAQKLATIHASLVLFPSTFICRGIASAIATRLNRALLTDCTAIDIKDDVVYGLKPSLDGKNMARYKFNGPTPYIAVMKDVAGSSGIQNAEIIFSGGRGLMNPDSFDALRKLAKCYGASIGASRPVVDVGWADADEQVGQTGSFVHPRVYVAFGISGAIQHLAGMKDSQCIIAVNNNKHSPIFQFSDYAIEADVNSIIRNMLQLLGVKL
ncbi:MAG: electron transfer flavoprotein subunit alpha/FixB family protein [Lachnospiraceae bacterium]|nr:electron transfer flavoprotein subunit alpha/FixB family protein [Lachnospiraceae bacterium]